MHRSIQIPQRKTYWADIMLCHCFTSSTCLPFAALVSFEAVYENFLTFTNFKLKRLGNDSTSSFFPWVPQIASDNGLSPHLYLH